MSLLRFGRNTANATPKPDDLWLPVAGGEIISAFEEYNVFSKMVRNKTITSGKEARFPATWKIGFEYHEPGTELLGLETENREYSIFLDDRPIVTHIELDDIDEKFAHFEVRSEYTKQMGAALAKADDRNVYRLLVKASRTAQGNATSFPGGGIDGNGGAITSSNFELPNSTNINTSAAADLLAAIDRAVVYWNLNNVPAEGRMCVVGYAMYQAIRSLGTLTSASAGPLPVIGHRDIDSVNPQRTQAMGRETYLVYNGVQITWSNNMVQTNDTLLNGNSALYVGDYTKTCGILFTPDAIGRVELMGVQMESDRIVQRQVDLFIAKMLTGGGTLRPYCAIELAKP